MSFKTKRRPPRRLRRNIYMWAWGISLVLGSGSSVNWRDYGFRRFRFSARRLVAVPAFSIGPAGPAAAREPAAGKVASRPLFSAAAFPRRFRSSSIVRVVSGIGFGCPAVAAVSLAFNLVCARRCWLRWFRLVLFRVWCVLLSLFGGEKRGGGNRRARKARWGEKRGRKALGAKSAGSESTRAKSAGVKSVGGEHRPIRGKSLR